MKKLPSSSQKPQKPNSFGRPNAPKHSKAIRIRQKKLKSWRTISVSRFLRQHQLLQGSGRFVEIAALDHLIDLLARDVFH